MTTLATLLILIAALIHASWNLLAKRLIGGAESVWLFTLVAVVLYAPLAAASVKLTGFRPDTRAWLFLAGTGMLQAIYFVVLRRGYAVGDLSMVYPLARGTGPLVAMLIATAVIGEHPSPVTIAGAFVISFGTLLMATPAHGTKDHRVTVAYGLATGVIIGCYTAWDGYAVGSIGIPALLLCWSADAGRLLWLTPIAYRRRCTALETWRSHRRAVLVIGVLSTASYVIVLSAMAMAPISSIAPAREVSIVVGTILGMTLLGEPGGMRRLGTALLITAGVGLVAVG